MSNASADASDVRFEGDRFNSAISNAEVIGSLIRMMASWELGPSWPFCSWWTLESAFAGDKGAIVGAISVQQWFQSEE